MENFGNVFDEINKEEEIKDKKWQKEQPVKEYLPVAYQIIQKEKRISLGVVSYRRVIIDTIPVENGCFERAKNRAIGKSQRIGKCFVIEICERNVFDNMTEETDDEE